jgi:hypothetical protein
MRNQTRSPFFHLTMMVLGLVLVGVVACDSLKSPSEPKEADEQPVFFGVVDDESGDRMPGVRLNVEFEVLAPMMETQREPLGYTPLTTIRQDDSPRSAKVIARAVGLPLQYQEFRGEVPMIDAAYPGTSTIAKMGTIRMKRTPFPSAGGGR